ncbi:MAG: hypothetical protein Tsb0020_36040 [Haliangiales bacterium]
MDTVLYALSSVVLRSANSVFDRVSYGLHRQSIVLLNFVNNFLPFVLLVLVLAATKAGDAELNWAVFLDMRLALFALSVQLVAFTFSFGFRRLTVSKVNVASRMGDLLIPLALMLSGSEVQTSDYVFAAAISVSTVLLGNSDITQRRLLLLPAGLITSAVVLQSLCGAFFFEGVSTHTVHLEVTTAIMGWRSVFCLTLVAVRRSSAHGAQLRVLWTNSRMRRNALLRAVFTVVSQLLFVLALSTDEPVIAWPILNSVTLFSMGFASVVIKEHPKRNEVLAIAAVVVLSLIKGML